MTVRDAVQLSNGFTDYADKSNVKVIRNISTENENIITSEFTIDFSDELNMNNIKLLPDDIIAISKTPFFQPTESFSVKGKVAVESTYPISYKKYLWDKIASDWQIGYSKSSIKIINLNELAPEIDKILNGNQQGRVVVKHGE